MPAGREKMLLHGFPSDFVTEGSVHSDWGVAGDLYHALQDADVAALAGNTISVPVIGGVCASDSKYSLYVVVCLCFVLGALAAQVIGVILSACVFNCPDRITAASRNADRPLDEADLRLSFYLSHVFV
jgi:hypothetical protein